MAKTKEFYAICRFYEPFVMGGDVWQWRRFKITAEPITLDRDIKAFVFQDAKHTKRWAVYEATTGGLLAEGKTKSKAIIEARQNIIETPTLEEQMKKLGDTSHFEEVDADEALRRIAKTK